MAHPSAEVFCDNFFNIVTDVPYSYLNRILIHPKSLDLLCRRPEITSSHITGETLFKLPFIVADYVPKWTAIVIVKWGSNRENGLRVPFKKKL